MQAQAYLVYIQITDAASMSQLLPCLTSDFYEQARAHQGLLMAWSWTLEISTRIRDLSQVHPVRTYYQPNIFEPI
jgi:hypothetical protein